MLPLEFAALLPASCFSLRIEDMLKIVAAFLPKMAIHVLNIYHPRSQTNHLLWMSFAISPFSADVEAQSILLPSYKVRRPEEKRGKAGKGDC